METTAHYDETKKEFIINCPTVASQKYWITNGAVHANYALVFAQTYVKNKLEGVNAFLVPVQDINLKQSKEYNKSSSRSQKDYSVVDSASPQ
jgi:acyl-CoA oxidase